jgi:hypothetical protein
MLVRRQCGVRTRDSVVSHFTAHGLSTRHTCDTRSPQNSDENCFTKTLPDEDSRPRNRRPSAVLSALLPSSPSPSPNAMPSPFSPGVGDFNKRTKLRAGTPNAAHDGVQLSPDSDAWSLVKCNMQNECSQCAVSKRQRSTHVYTQRGRGHGRRGRGGDSELLTRCVVSRRRPLQACLRRPPSRAACVAWVEVTKHVPALAHC